MSKVKVVNAAVALRRTALLPLILPMLMLCVFFVYPVGRLLWASFTDPHLGFSNYTGVFADSTALRILSRTFVVAAIVTGVTLLFGYPYAYVMTLVTKKWRTVLMVMVLIPFWTSLIARSFAWIVIMQPDGPIDHVAKLVGISTIHLLGTTTGVVIGMTQVLLPFTVLPLFANLERIDRRLMAAAYALGARPIVAFLRVYLPLSVPGLVAAGLLTFVMSLGFYVTPDLLGSPQQDLISQYIATQVNVLLDFPSAGALSATLLAITLVVLAVATWLLRGLLSTKGRS